MRGEARPDTGLALYDLRTIVGPAPADLPLPTDFAGGDEVSEALVLSPDRIEDLIRNAIAPESWDMDPANALRTSEGRRARQSFGRKTWPGARASLADASDKGASDKGASAATRPAQFAPGTGALMSAKRTCSMSWAGR